MSEVFIHLTCGIEGPRFNLTTDQHEHISNLVQQLNVEWVGEIPPGFLGYGSCDCSIMYEIDIYQAGLIRVYNKPYVWNEFKDFQDTTGINDYIWNLAKEPIMEWSTQWNTPI